MAIKNPFQYLYSHIKYPWNIDKLKSQGDQKLYDALNRIVDALGTSGSSSEIFNRTLLIKNSTIGTDIADAVPVQSSGTLQQVVGVLKDTIVSDLIVNINVNGKLLISCTILHTQLLLTPIIYTNFKITKFNTNDILTADIITSDGSIDSGGIASFTIEWIA